MESFVTLSGCRIFFGNLPMEELPRKSSNDVRAFLLEQPKQVNKSVAKRRPVSV